MKKIRVMEMIDRPSLGGGQTALLLLAENLDRSRFEVFISSGGDGPLAEEAGQRGISYIPVVMGKRLSVRPVFEIAAALRENEIDILHTHGGIAGIFGRSAARRARTPAVVHTLHGIHYLHYRNPFLRWMYVLLERRYSRSTDRLILVCQSDLRQARKHRLAPSNRMSVILNGTDVRRDVAAESSARLRNELGWPPGRPVVGAVARLHRQKGVLDLLRASPKILSAFPEARIAVVGDGPEASRLRSEARRLSLEARFLFLGERKDAAPVMSLFDIFVLPSLWEGLPFVLVEAAALGRPIVATAVDGVPEMLEDGKTGLLVPPNDPAALAGAVIRLLRDRDEAGRIGETARRLVPPRFPLRRMIDQTQNLYLDVLGAKTSPAGIICDQ
jgi:glycosyltransferase involved in cell wall biosynthesis